MPSQREKRSNSATLRGPGRPPSGDFSTSSDLRREQITETKAIFSQDTFANTIFHGGCHIGTVEHKRMKFSVLAAGIDGGRQFCQHFLVVKPTGKFLIEDVGIHAADDGLKPLGEKAMSQLGRVPSP